VEGEEHGESHEREEGFSRRLDPSDLDWRSGQIMIDDPNDDWDCDSQRSDDKKKRCA
jgi:hypothetical protein